MSDRRQNTLSERGSNDTTSMVKLETAWSHPRQCIHIFYMSKKIRGSPQNHQLSVAFYLLLLLLCFFFTLLSKLCHQEKKKLK